MELGPLRSLAFALNVRAHGVPAAVTRPGLPPPPVLTAGIWVTAPLEEPQPYGVDLGRRDPRRVLALPRADLADVPRGTQIVAPETLGAAPKTWRVDGYERTAGDHWRVIVVPD